MTLKLVVFVALVVAAHAFVPSSSVRSRFGKVSRELQMMMMQRQLTLECHLSAVGADLALFCKYWDY